MSQLVCSVKTASGAVAARRGRVRNIYISTGAVAGVTWKLYDNASAASGTVIGHFVTGGTSAVTGGVGFEWPVQFANGCYAELVAGAGTISVLYE